MPGEKTSKAQIAIRVEIIVALVCGGLTKKEIFQYIAKKHESWNVTERTLYNYVRRARKKIEKIADYKIDYEIGLGLSRLEDLYKRTVTIQDYKTSLSVQKERHELLGIKKNDTVNINLKDDISGYTKEELETAINEFK